VKIRHTAPPISPLDKIIVAVAGPLFSFLLAIVFATIVWVVGSRYPLSAIRRIGWVDANGPAGKAGLRPGDKILEIDGHGHVLRILERRQHQVADYHQHGTISRLILRGGKEYTANAEPFHQNQMV